ncbi:MAG: cytochrome c oxidase subunit 3 [Acidobacteria bacterium]|nr:cytochrome c oxidase subunit 3 [Acidobacteriota bacterium]
MPASIQTVSVEKPEHRTAHGGGNGRPPHEDIKYTGGGGDNDEFRNRRSEGHLGPRETLHRYRISLFSLLIGDTMFFIAAAGIFFINRSSYHANAYGRIVQDWHAIAVPPILWLNTAVLLLSSFTMEMARRQMFREEDLLEEWLGLGKPSTRRTRPWLIATWLLGALFLAGQVVAWNQLKPHALVYAGQSRQSFYLLTGAHAAHIVLGLVALLACLVLAPRLRRVELRQVMVDCTSWYWHAMGIFWIALFVLLEWFQ